MKELIKDIEELKSKFMRDDNQYLKEWNRGNINACGVILELIKKHNER